MLPIPGAPDAHSRLGAVLVCVLCFVTWALSHSYVGLFHDAGLYTLQALSHLPGGSLKEDVFLHFGSQDRFTLFSPMYAQASQMLGVERAAALLTLLSHCALIGAAWAVGRAVSSSTAALLGIAVLIAIPGDYGADRIFTYLEPFLTPRMGAEALTLAAIGAALTSRRWWAGALMVAAALLHPVMAAAGLAALAFLYVGFPRPRWALALAGAGLAAITLLSRFDPAWLELVRQRSPYLFLAHWQLDDWSRAAVTLTTLIMGIRSLPSTDGRILSRITLATVMSGFLLTLIACDGLRIVLLTELQPWRWHWLGAVVAALLLPEIVRALWSKETAGRTSALLLIAAWVFATDVYALAAAGMALLALRFLHRLKPGEARWVAWGTWGLLLLALAWRLASNLQFTDSFYLEHSIPGWLRRAMSFVHDGTAPTVVIALVAWVAPRLKTAALAAACAAALLPGIAVLPETAKSWTAREYPPDQQARFATFRALIPEGSQVFWPASPVAAWLLLNRPSYLSVIQTSGMVFSRGSALELQRRANALDSIIPQGTFMSWTASGTGLELSRDQLARACNTREFDFLVTNAKLSAEAVAFVPPTSGAAPRNTYLYRCRSPHT